MHTYICTSMFEYLYINVDKDGVQQQYCGTHV